MFELALGKCKKVKNTYIRDLRTGKMILDKSEEETIGPNPTMLIFSLKNLSTNKWKDRRDIDITNTESPEKKAMDNFDSFSEQMKKLEDDNNG